MEKGYFISFEGGEGAGKTTQIKRLAARLQQCGIDTVVTRELGGTAGAEALRPIMQSGDVNAWDAISEALIVSAGRHDHVHKVIKPALAAGKWVLSDRFCDSTSVYQGFSNPQPEPEAVKIIHQVAIGDFRPDLTLIFDMDTEIGLQRALEDAKTRNEENTRFERMGLAYHQRVREGYLQIARDNPARCVVINALAERDDVEAQVWQIVAQRFGLQAAA